MRHQMSGRKLGRTSEHRRALFRNQLKSLILHERIITTLPKAKELRPIAEKVVTLCKHQDPVHARRLAVRWLDDRDLVHRLFTTIGPRFLSRPGGYLRIVKLGPRRGDGAELAIIEFVDYKLPEARTKDGGEGAKVKKPTRTSAVKAKDGGEGAKVKKPTRTSAVKAKDGGEDAKVKKPTRTSAVKAKATTPAS